MTTQYRILERQQFEKESVYVAQRTKKFLGLFTYWSSYKENRYGDACAREFDTIEEAKAHIARDAKYDRWYTNSEDRVIAVYQLNSDGELEEVV